MQVTKQSNRGYKNLPTVLPPGESLSICPIGVAFAWSITAKHEVIHKTEIHKRICIIIREGPSHGHR